MGTPVDSVSKALSSFFDWLTNWNKTSASRNDKKSIKYGKQMARKILSIKINDIVARANFDEFVEDIQNLKILANKFIDTLD